MMNISKTHKTSKTSVPNKRYITKRDGTNEDLDFNKIYQRIENSSIGLENDIFDFTLVYQDVVRGFASGMTTNMLDIFAAESANAYYALHPNYGKLASRITTSSHHKNTSSSFYDSMKLLHSQKHKGISDETMEIVTKYRTVFESLICHDRDYDIDYFGQSTLYRSYLSSIRVDSGKIDNNGAKIYSKTIVSRPQYMFLRVAIGIHGDDLDAIIDTYESMSTKQYIHATPTLFNSGTVKPQMSSCFLMDVGDSIEEIADSWKQCALISKHAGGIGINMNKIRASNSQIGADGVSNGIIPWLRIKNNIALAVDQGGGKRKGSFAVYIEPWHADIYAFLDIKNQTGAEEDRCRDLFTALWIPDLFMKRVQNGGTWSLFCPNDTGGLGDLYGDEFENAYIELEKSGKCRRFLSHEQLMELWVHILSVKVETGIPYIMFKDAVNSKSNQKNLGTIKSSNLCCEIVQYTSNEEVAVCNLASINLQAFVKKRLKNDKTIIKLDEDITDDENVLVETFYDFEGLAKATKACTRNLNKVIDRSFYPVPESRNSNVRHRPIGIGVQGLADAFIRMRYPFESEDARKLNRNIFEVMYYAALRQSCKMAMEKAEKHLEEFKNSLCTSCNAKKNEKGFYDLSDTLDDPRHVYDCDKCGYCSVLLLRESGAYASFRGSPLSKGIFHFDMCNEEGATRPDPDLGLDWDGLRNDVMKYGTRNSLLLATMPTASTSQILGNNECFEPYTSNVYDRKVIAGDFTVVNEHLVKDLYRLGLWNKEIKEKFIAARGSIQGIDGIPDDIKNLYKTVYEIKQRCIIDMAAERGVFIDQTQSMNIFLSGDEIKNKLAGILFYAWKKGLKTGSYYLRTLTKVNAIQFTVESTAPVNKVVDNVDDDGDCDMCGS